MFCPWPVAAKLLHYGLPKSLLLLHSSCALLGDLGTQYCMMNLPVSPLSVPSNVAQARFELPTPITNYDDDSVLPAARSQQPCSFQSHF